MRPSGVAVRDIQQQSHTQQINSKQLYCVSFADKGNGRTYAIRMAQVGIDIISDKRSETHTTLARPHACFHEGRVGSRGHPLQATLTPNMLHNQSSDYGVCQVTRGTTWIQAPSVLISSNV